MCLAPPLYFGRFFLYIYIYIYIYFSCLFFTCVLVFQEFMQHKISMYILSGVLFVRQEPLHLSFRDYNTLRKFKLFIFTKGIQNLILM